MTRLAIRNEKNIYRGGIYSMYRSYTKDRFNQITVNLNEKISLGELYSIEHSFHGMIPHWDINELKCFNFNYVRYHFKLNGKISILLHGEIFSDSNAIVLDDINHETTRRKISFRKKSSTHDIFTNDTILYLLLFEYFPKPCIENSYTNVIFMIDAIDIFGRVNHFWRKQCTEIKKIIMGNLMTLVQSCQIETFHIIPDIGKQYICMIPDNVFTYGNSYEITYKYFGSPTKMYYAGVCKSHDAEKRTYTFEKNGRLKKIKYNYYGRKTCFNEIENNNIDKDPYEILCKKKSKELFEIIYKGSPDRNNMQKFLTMTINNVCDEQEELKNRRELKILQKNVIKYAKELKIAQPPLVEI